MSELYVIGGPGSAMHVIPINGKKTLCGIDPPFGWEMAYEGEPYAEIGEFCERHHATMGEGFYVGTSFAGDYEFCKRCYQALKKIKVK